MRMYGVFAKPKMTPESAGLNGSDAEKAWQQALAESDKNPIVLCRYGEDAQKKVKEYSDGQMEIREVDVTVFEVVTRRPVTL